MIGPLKELFDVLERRHAENATFARRLHPGRTVFLSELIQDVRRPDRFALLAAPWLDAGRFTARIASACVFLDGVARAEDVKGWEGMPFAFLQAGSVAEDALQHQEILARDRTGHYAKTFAHLLPQVRYLHTHTNFSSFMRGSWKRGSLVIGPHFGFMAGQGGVAYDRTRRPFRLRTLALGYRLAEFPYLLGVSPEIATDYLARIVVHDLCHYFLPSTPTAAEGFHNVAALAAMGELPPIAYRNAWEKFVHAECVDPTFCLRAEREIAEVRRALGVASLVQEDYLVGLAKWYAHPNAAKKRHEAWGLPVGLPESEAGTALRALIRQAQADGFRLYVRLMESP